ncbi:acetylxylan esterase [Testudinibacter sp. TR-2022]|uniref:alpha/beta hydrolase n=1 Tax=Testudinibacter sp. TR-2022 TaxID=2585029 RepID=UPI00111BC6D8|nr:alpha/beta hydrolase [Testudinibacter sp. TR-2022]TNH03764.1 acetylxylan esterase [Pasteurellaceae bacterium Phil31]TNH11707.1 acetylxylan esterase [Testudinibacter sp. TR-2022]TNH12077.1 acetylxylan esterase [Testudinibacter sp. TR-2022]TNH15664.1 acetylxylan esterase [Testudinibacter sp. TR-2022]TNH20311.1 acetylxylan esterase [Testudinibacter sp. TR-2022]
MKNRYASRPSFLGAILFAILTLVFAYLASLIERDFGRIDVRQIQIMTEEMQPMTAKLYRPLTATAENPAPGLLALHGYQSDKEATSTFGALELAKRGFVVLAIDQFGHGYSTTLPTSNKNMSGSNNGYQYLKSLPFVDQHRLGIFGHSTGALNAIRVAKLNPDHKAVNGLSSNGGDPEIHNYLLTQGLYEEIGGYRERSFPVKELVHNSTRLLAFSLPESETLKWGYTYGNFADGSARRADLVEGTHLGVMIAKESNQRAIEWFNTALQNGDKSHWIDPTQQTYWYKEVAGLFALFFAMISSLFVANALLQTPYFSAATQPVTTKTAISTKTWWRFAILNIVTTLVLYPLLTQWGGANEPIAAHLAFMPLEMGNGIITWLAVSAVLNLIFFLVWKKTAPQISLVEFGIFSQQHKLSTANIILRFLALSVVLIGWLYILAGFAHWYWGTELRFLWPFLKPLTPERFNLFLVYWLPILAFFFIYNGLILTVQMKQPLAKSAVSTLVIWTLKVVFAAVGGLCILWLFHFIPNFMQIGPGFDLIGLPQFGGRWMMMLAVIIPQFIVLLLINNWCYLKTGYLYFGVFFTSLLMTWILVGGQVIGRFLA